MGADRLSLGYDAPVGVGAVLRYDYLTVTVPYRVAVSGPIGWQMGCGGLPVVAGGTAGMSAAGVWTIGDGTMPG